ncbi:hypothetical protein ACFE04_010055 [Oxalis oulophora]
MGIKDLLRFMKPYTEPIHIRKFAGKRVGIDAYSWLHKGAYSCSMELCLDSNSKTKWRYLDYCMHRINLLRHYKITPVVVFDGGSIPCKAATEHERHRKRRANLDLAMETLREGNVNAASELFQRAVSITPSMAHQLIQLLRSENIEFVVAPYEADAQLAYLSNLKPEKGGIHAVITEDSDLIAYGCQATIFKMDRYGNAEQILLDKVFASEIPKPSFRQFDKNLFTGMCVLAGCDFLPSVPGIGIAKAHALVSKYRNLDRVLSVLKLKKCTEMPEDYCQSFKEAIAVFQHARIYDSKLKKLKHMKPLPNNLVESFNGELSFLGPEIPPTTAIAIAEGKVDPISMKTFDCGSPPNLRYQPDPIFSETSDRLVKPKTEVVSTQESGFLVMSTNTTNIRVEERKIAIKEQDHVLTETRTSEGTVKLEKLVLPFVTHQSVVSDEVPAKTPNNNPFKRIKLEEMSLHQILRTKEEINDLTDHEELDVLCMTPNNNPFKVSTKESSRKRGLEKISPKSEDNKTEVVSVVTEVANSDVVCVPGESQESVNSEQKSKSVTNKKGKGYRSNWPHRHMGVRESSGVSVGVGGDRKCKNKEDDQG